MTALNHPNSLADSETSHFTTRGKVVVILREWIHTGRWSSGDVVPSGRRLTQMLGANRPAVQEAIQTLVREGLLAMDGRKVHVVSKRDHIIPRSAILIGSPPQSRADRHGGWAAAITTGASEAVGIQGLNVISLHPDRVDDAVVSALVQGRPYGVILTDCEHGHAMKRELLGRLKAVGIPVVIYSGDDGFAEYDRVHSDHEAGTYELTRWLIARGRRRIAHLFVRPDSSYWTKARWRGYQRAMVDAGLQPLPMISAECVTAITSQDGSRERFDLMRHVFTGCLAPYLLSATPVDAILTESDGQVFPLAAACRALGKTPGTDVSLVGFDNYFSSCGERAYEEFVPQATMDKRNSEMGIELVRVLVDRIEGRLGAEPVTRKVQPELVIPG